MFAFFERRLRPTAHTGSAPPQSLLGFYWHFVRQTRGLFGLMFLTGLAVALVGTPIPIFIGRRIVEPGTHTELIARGGHYAALWAHQSGGSLAEDVARPAAQAAASMRAMGEATSQAVLDPGSVDEMRTAERAEPDVDAEPAPARN